MSKGNLVLRSNGIREMLRSQDLLTVCEQYANQMGASLGDGYSVSTYIGPNRCNASVHAVSEKAQQDTMDNNTMLKAGGSV